jgi:hypothetical protein
MFFPLAAHLRLRCRGPQDRRVGDHVAFPVERGRMRLVEVDDVHGVRAAVTPFASDTSSVRFVLVPVSPLGVPAHYEAIRETLHACDLVVTMAPQAEAGGAAGPGDPGGGSQWERIGRGRHIRLTTPPQRWADVDRPFITAPGVAADAAGSQGGRPARRPRLLVALAPLRPLMAMAFARFGTRAMVGQMLSHAASVALSEPAHRGFAPVFDWDPRYQQDGEQLAETVRRLHAERQAQELRVAVVHTAEILPGVARALGSLGYSPGDVEWITVFPWLSDDA